MGQTGLLLCLYVVTPDARQSCEPSVGDWLALVAVCVASTGKIILAHGWQFAGLGGNLRTLDGNLRTLDGLSAGLALDGRFAGHGDHLSTLDRQYASLALRGQFAGLGGHLRALCGQSASLAIRAPSVGSMLVQPRRAAAGRGGHLSALGRRMLVSGMHLHSLNYYQRAYS